MSSHRTSTNVPQPANQVFDHRHRFKPGHKKMGGRRKGTPNARTNFKEHIHAAAELLGEDGKGKGGETGYCVGVGKKFPKIFANWIGKILSQEAARSAQELEQADAPAHVIISKDDENL